MSGPPKHIDPPALYSLLTTMPRPYRVVDFPRKGEDGKPLGQVALVPLNQAENIAAGLEAELYVRKALPDSTITPKDAIGYNLAYSNEACVQQLWRSVRDASDPTRKVFQKPDDLRRLLTPDETACLFSMWIDACAEVGPMIGALSVAEREAWIDKLIAGGEATPIPFSSLETLRTLVRSLVNRLRTSQTALSSLGTPQESQSEEPGPELSGSEDSPELSDPGAASMVPS